MATTHEVTKLVTANADDTAGKKSNGAVTYNNADTQGFGRWDGELARCAFRFVELGLPANIVIVEAYVTLTSQYSRNDDILSKWYGEDAESPSAFGATEDFTLRDYTTAYVAWDFTTNWVADTEYKSPELKSIIQEISDNHGSLSEIALFLEGNNPGAGFSCQFAYPHDSSTTKCAKLYIKYYYGGRIVKQVAALADDSQSRGGFNNNSGENGFGDWGGVECGSAFRFLGITIPAGVTFEVAKIVFTAQFSRADNPKVHISAEDALNPAAYGAVEDFTIRTYTTAVVDWTITWGVTDVEYDSPSLIAIINELVASYTYENDEMAFMLFGFLNAAGVYQATYPHEVSATKCPVLIIEWELIPPPAGLGNKSANMGAKMIAGKLI